jgi:hypothetical protein
MGPWDVLDVGGVEITKSASVRMDIQPNGERNNSGLGRRGAKFVVTDATEIPLSVVRSR